MASAAGRVTPARVRRLRASALSASLVAAVLATWAFVQVAGSAAPLGALDWLRAALIGLTMLWLAWGAAQGIVGLLQADRPPPRAAGPPRGRTVILAPICREDPWAVFARLAAIEASLAELGPGGRVDLVVLSDTADPELAREEARAFERLRAGRRGAGRLSYRRRTGNAGRKAGNIAEFLARSGGAYDHALILDADSLMEGATIVEMIRRMEADPGLGLLQTLPMVVRARSLFGRALGFSAALHAPIFSRGVAAMQGREGPYWGHNALIRVAAFAGACHLPPLSGRPPFGGHVLSHDYVEAALLVRGGWRVRLDPDLGGSFEEAPGDLLDYARRERRWCQGNLQYVRLLGAPGLTPWSRLALAQAVASYVVPLLWLALLVTAPPAVIWDAPPDYFRGEDARVPVFPVDQTARAVALLLGVAGVLLLPKLAVMAKALAWRAGPAFGGAPRLVASTLAEIALTSVTAPILLMFQARAVAEVCMGRDGGWPASPRGVEVVPLGRSARATWWIVLAGVAGLAAAAAWAPALVPWALPVTGPMIAAPLVIAWTSRPGAGWLFATPEEGDPSPVLRRSKAILAEWRAGPDARPAPGPGPAPDLGATPTPTPARGA